MNIKYQIFISSTYEDLLKEREQVIKATLEMGHIPVGMEMFSAADEEQWKLIKRQIDECDYYAVLIAHRYGSTVEAISYTEKEYDYAVSKGVPVIGFIIEDEADWPATRHDKEAENIKKLRNFKEKITRRTVSFWKNAEDLYGRYAIALMKLITSNPRPGWARATDITGPDVINEISRLSSENAELRKNLEEAYLKIKIEGKLEVERILDILKKNKFDLSIGYQGETDWNRLTKVSMYDVFYRLAPELMIEISTIKTASYLGFIFNPDKKKDVRRKWPIPANHVSAWISDLLALGLVQPSPQKHSVKDTNQYWTLTEWGREIYSTIRRKRLEKGQPTEIKEVPGKIDEK